MTSDNHISIVFTSSDHWISRAIRWLTDGRVSHCFIEYSSSTWGGRWAAESAVGGVRKIPIHKAKKDVFAEYSCDGFEANRAIKGLSDLVGEKYDYAGLFLLGGIYLMWKVFRMRIKHPTISSQSQKCSELVANLFIAAGLPGTEKWNAEEKTPEQLLDYCEAHPTYFKKRNL